MQLSAVYCKLCGAICSPSKLDSVLMIVMTKIPAMTAVCRPSTDEAPGPEELDAPNKLFQMCQAVVQRYYMHGRPVNPGSARGGRWAEFRKDVAKTAQQRQLGNWTGDKSMWYRLVTNSSVKALDNLLSVLEKNRQVVFRLDCRCLHACLVQSGSATVCICLWVPLQHD